MSIFPHSIQRGVRRTPNSTLANRSPRAFSTSTHYLGGPLTFRFIIRSVMSDTPAEPQYHPSSTKSSDTETSLDGDLAYLGALANGGLLSSSPPSPTQQRPKTPPKPRKPMRPMSEWNFVKQRKPQPARELMDKLRPVYKPTYYFEDGLRRVVPYDFTYNTFCKERWRGKSLVEIFLTEFRDRPEEYYVCIAILPVDLCRLGSC